MPAGDSRDAAVLGHHGENGDYGLPGVLADLTLAVGSIGQRLEEQRVKPANPKIPWEACHPVWQTGQIPLTAGAGTLLQSNLYGPELPFWWDVRSIRVWGFSAGTVTVYRNNPGSLSGEQFGATTTPGEFTWSAQLLLAPQDTLVFGATSITGSVTVAIQAIEVTAAWLPEYLM